VNILIVKLSALGDVTHTLPALTALRRAHPGARIDWLIEEAAAPIVEGHVALDRALVWSRRKFTRALRSWRIGEAGRILGSFVRELRATRYDLVIDFQALLKSGIWVFLARARRKAGFGRGMDRSEGSYIFLSERIPAVSMEIHALDRGLMLLEALGVRRGPVEYDFPISQGARDQVGELLGVDRRGGCPEGAAAPPALIAMHPMTRWPTKLWTAEAFASTADALMERGHRVVFTGALQDSGALDAIVGRLRRPALRLDGRLDLKGLAALFERSNVVVSTDTGPMHIAAAVGTPVVALFGPTAPNRTGPHGPGHVVLRAGMACSPCFSRRCERPAAEPMACMHRIPPASVVEAVERVLHDSPRRAFPGWPIEAGDVGARG
jgi:3-deoxy-D-manno-octulosonic-acid transferase/heptosyltransferase-1